MLRRILGFKREEGTKKSENYVIIRFVAYALDCVLYYEVNESSGLTWAGRVA